MIRKKNVQKKKSFKLFPLIGLTFDLAAKEEGGGGRGGGGGERKC